jgi:hypothetical protein
MKIELVLFFTRQKLQIYGKKEFYKLPSIDGISPSCQKYLPSGGRGEKVCQQ